MKRYWVKLTLEVQEYDEKRLIVKEAGKLRFEPATTITPEPAKFIRETLAEHSARVAEVVEFINPKDEV